MIDSKNFDGIQPEVVTLIERMELRIDEIERNMDRLERAIDYFMERINERLSEKE